MKTVNVMFVAVLMAVMSFGFAENAERPGVENQDQQLPKVIPLELAMQNPDLVLAMFNQLTKQILVPDKPFYTVKIKYDNRIYFVCGTYGAWMHFFSIQPISKNGIANH
ncbi:MAG: hypothetical protein R2764_03230 [Bacteroidales bacterium]